MLVFNGLVFDIVIKDNTYYMRNSEFEIQIEKSFKKLNVSWKTKLLFFKMHTSNFNRYIVGTNN